MSGFKLPTVVTGLSQSMQQIGTAVKNFGKDGRYFNSTKKGELQELRKDLHSSSKAKKKETVKKVIAAMTVGKDVSSLFPDVVNCMQTSNIELKKLVYLYVINYAKVKPELVILAINTFRRDSSDNNPLIRALAVRTMGCIRLNEVLEYLLEPLRRACKDSDPYVRKTAAICICKLYSTSPEAVIDQGLIDVLYEMLLDVNPSVVANAVASLAEISEESGTKYMNFTEPIVLRLLTALGECSEWGQIFILDSIATYDPPDSSSASTILNRIIPRLNHANPAVVLSTIRVILHLFNYIDDDSLISKIKKKLGPPLVTLLSSEPEVHYVALRNISLIVQKYPSILANEIKMFYCKYDDPLYVKLEKLEIIVRLTTNDNINQVLQEFKEYATEIDVDFVRRTIRSIGHCAIRLPDAAGSCVTTLMSLIETRINYVVQEIIIVMRDILRKYPNQYESVISILFQHLTTLDDPDAKAAIIWLVGEYAQRIQNADELIESFIETFPDDPVFVRLQILTATVKLFLKCPSKSQALVTRILKLCTEETSDPDLRDRGFIYWRLLATDPEATKKIVLASKPPISEQSYNIDMDILDSLIANLSTLASVFHKLPESLVTRLRVSSVHAIDSDEESTQSNESEEVNENLRVPKEKKYVPAAIEFSSESEKGNSSEKQSSWASDAGSSHGSSKSSKSAANSQSESDDDSDLLNLEGKDYNSVQASASKRTDKPVTDTLNKLIDYFRNVILLSADTKGTSGNQGLQIAGQMYQKGVDTFLYLSITNCSNQVLESSHWAVQINKNSFGFAPKNPTQLNLPNLNFNQTADTHILLTPNVNLSQQPPNFPLIIQVAIRSSLDIFYLKPVVFDVSFVFINTNQVSEQVYKTHWQRMGDSKEEKIIGICTTPLSGEAIASTLLPYRVQVISTNENESATNVQCAIVTTNKLLFLFNIMLAKMSAQIQITMRADATQMFVALQDFFVRTLGLSQTAKVL